MSGIARLPRSRCQQVGHPRGVDDLLTLHPLGGRPGKRASFLSADEAATAILGGRGEVVHVALPQRSLGYLQLVDAQARLASALRHSRSYELRQRVRPSRSFLVQAARVPFSAFQRVGVASHG